MGIYSKTSLQMVVDLLNASNSGLPVPISLSNVKFGIPTAITPGTGQIQDTQIKVIALASGQYVGNQLLTYRRLDSTVLFRSVPLRVDLYSAAAAVGVSPYSMSQLLPYINAKYGLNLQTTDITDVAFAGCTTNAQPTIGLVAGSLNSTALLTFTTTNTAWKGSITVFWVQAPQDLSTLLATGSLETALTYPGNRDVVNNTVYVPNLDTYYVDFTDYLGTGGSNSTLPVAIANSSITNTANYNTLVGIINTLTGKTYTNGGGAAGSTLMDLTGAAISAVIDLTTGANQALYPEADYRYYNRLLVITLAAGNTWGAGQMFLHYNV